MRAAAFAVALLVAVCGCRGSHVKNVTPEPDPIGRMERRCERGKLDDCVTLGSYYEVGWRFDPEDYDEEDEEDEDRYVRDENVEYEESTSGQPVETLIPAYKGPPRTVIAVDPVRARALYAHACTGGEGTGCFNLGGMQRDGRGGPVDLAAADVSFVSACNLRDLRGCTAHALAVEQGLGIPADPERGRALMRQLCDEDGQRRACVNVGVYLSNDGLPHNDRQAQEYFRRACWDGDALGCHYEASLQLRDTERSPWERRRALDEERGACEDGIGAACALAGQMYRDGILNDDDEDVIYDDDEDRPAEVAELFRMGCDLGDADACQGYLLLLFDGEGVRQNVVAAARIAGQQCTAGHVASCQSLGYFYEVGVGVPLDLDRAASIYRAACESNTPAGAGSCSNLADLVAERGDRALAATLAQKGCDLGDPRGCNLGGVNIVDGVWPGDPAAGEKMLRRACALARTAEDGNEYCAAAAGIR